ncbi:MAG: hypothetical protein GX896_00475, partial [Clostridiales bacterium]|nr:hypothetical protein [Clostridiales bacterium]
MRGIFKKQKTNKISRKIISGMLTIIMLMGSFSIPTSMNTVKATDGDSNNGGFSVKINWNGTGQTPNLYEYKSETTEYKLVRLKVAYKNNDVENTYAPGQLVITVPGLKNAVRSGNSGTPVAIAADLAAMGTKYYDWNYTYNSKKDTYTFVNNFKIDVHSSFEGSFEIIWNLHSRDTIHNYSQNLSATLRTAHAETTTSDEIKYTQARTRDEYTVSKSASQLYNADGLTDALPDGTTKDQYTWAEYTVRGIDRNKARDVNGAERFDLWFPEGTIVQGGGVVKTENIQTIGGIKYECWSLVKDINYSTLNPYIEGIKVAYPNDKYGGRRVTSYVNIMGTYFDETQEMELAKNALTIDLANYGFMDLPGDIYDDIKQTFGVKNKYVENHCTGDRNCYKYGAISHIHLFNGKQEYTSNFKYTLNYSEKYADYYDIEFVDDFMDVVLKDGSLYQLKDTEYHFTKVEIPSNLNILNLNKIPVAADKYDVEIYIRRAGAEKFEETPFTTVKITSETQTINVPEDTVGVKIIIRRVDECFNIGTFSNVNNGIKVKYVFHVKNPDIRTDSGKHTNLMYTKLYSSRGNEYTWVNNDYGYNTYDNDREYYRDIITYGNSFDREAADIHILEIPNQYHIRNNIVALAESKENYNFTGSMFTNFTLGDGNTLEKFSMYTIIPEGLRLNELY